MKTLHLTLKKKWFDMISSGEKKEEYRELKPYWKKRLEESVYEPDYDCMADFFKEFDVVVFKNGYSTSAPTITVKWLGCDISFGARKEWGGNPAVKCFIIKLGEIISNTTPVGATTVENFSHK